MEPVDFERIEKAISFGFMDTGAKEALWEVVAALRSQEKRIAELESEIETMRSKADSPRLSHSGFGTFRK